MFTALNFCRVSLPNLRHDSFSPCSCDDSCGYWQAVQEYLVSELSSRDKNRQGLFMTEPRPPENAPRQRNGSDCGVLMLHVMEVQFARARHRCFIDGRV